MYVKVMIIKSIRADEKLSMNNNFNQLRDRKTTIISMYNYMELNKRRINSFGLQETRLDSIQLN